MRIKGAAMLARAREISSRFGEERWNAFVARYSARHERFGDSFFLTSRIPIGSFLEFQEALIKEFYDGDEGQYFESGRSAARWAFTSGPYMRVVEDREDIASLLETRAPRIWESYLDFGRVTVRAEDDRVDVLAEGLPSRHPYFMLTLPGYMLGTLEIIGGLDPSYEEIESDQPGTVHWVFRVAGWNTQRAAGG